MISDSEIDKILIVDDEDNIRNLLDEVLSFEGYKTDQAENGINAITKLENNAYDLIITDLIMPGIDGLGVLKRAKELNPDIVVIMMTGQATMESAIKSLKLGANDFITKPFEITPLLQILEKNLLNQKLKRENITLLKQTQLDRDELKKLVSELEILQNLSVKFSHRFDISQLYSLILESIPEVIDFDFAATINFEPRLKYLYSKSKLSDEILDWISKSVEPVFEKEKLKLELKKDFELKYINENVESEVNKKVKSHVNIPLFHQDKIFGIIIVASFTEGTLGSEEKAFLNKIANQTTEMFSKLKEVVENQKRRLQVIIDSIPDGVIIYNKLNNEVLLNPSAIKIIGKEKISDVSYEYIEHIFNVKFDELLKQIEDSKKPLIKEIKLESIDKQLIYDANVATILGEEGDFQGLLMVLRDVTRERELDNLKKEFISNVSHELRTPAAIVKEFISIMKDELGGPVTEGQREYLDTMTNNIERLLRLIENLLNMSRIESGRIKIKRSRFNPNQHLKNVSEGLKLRLKKKNINLKLNIHKELPEIYADPDAFTQIITNLVDNARKFSPEGTEVTISAVFENNDVLFSVRDQGKGIPKEHLTKIFERFHRIENEEELRQEGSGLGLPIIKELISQHHGKVWVESELNKGSTFYFSLNQKEYIKDLKSKS
ncbi:ATP-binding protein [candidate division KSB1 bacterium]